jgi:acetyl-CoA carboxylase carboxyl transferase subunit beta
MSSVPKEAVSALIFHGDKVLLIQRGHEPAMGKWSLPGGGVEPGETYEQALIREVREETGLSVSIHDEVFHQEIALSATQSYDLRTFIATYRGGDIQAGDDAAEATWIPIDEISALETTPRLEEIIQLGRSSLN